MRTIVLTLALLATAANATPATSQQLTLSTFKPTGVADYDETVLRYLKNMTPKIVGGVNATRPYPWQVSLIVAGIPDTSRAHFCGGSVYNARWIITAAHCMDGLSPAQFQVVSGTAVLDKSAKRVAVARRIIHGAYNSNSFDSDIALIELQQPLELGSAVKSIGVLASSEEAAVLSAGSKLVVTGWGATKQGGDTVINLREVTVPFVTNSICNDPLSYAGQITANMICAGIAEGGKDSCQGDSGGPLVHLAATDRLVGIVSWGEGCANPGKYGVYTRIANFKPWVEACTTGGTCAAKP